MNWSQASKRYLISRYEHGLRAELAEEIGPEIRADERAKVAEEIARAIEQSAPAVDIPCDGKLHPECLEYLNAQEHAALARLIGGRPA